MSCESEYVAPAYASQELVYLSDLLSELTFPQFSSVQMHEDNMGALQLSGTTASSSRTKHICTRCQISARAGCIEQDHRISCQDNRSVGGHFHQIFGPPEVYGRPGQDNQLRFLSYSTRSSIFASSLVLRGVCLLFYLFSYALYNDLFVFQTLSSHTRISSLRYTRFLSDTLGHDFQKCMF